MAKRFRDSLNKKIETDEKFKEEWEKGKERREIVNQIIEVRIKLGLTQKELATLMKTSQSYISRVENGDINVGLTFLERLKNSLGLTIKTIISIPKGKKKMLQNRKRESKTSQ